MDEIEFHEHPNFSKSFDAFIKKYREGKKGLIDFKKIAKRQFHPTSPQQIIGPGKLHRIHQDDSYVVWKAEVAVKGLRKNQSPRIWFAVRGSFLVFLCIGTHIDNYDDNELTSAALERISDIF